MKTINTILLLRFCTVLIFLISCTYTTTKSKEPIIMELDQLNKDLAILVTAENIDLAGKETTTNGRTSSELEIRIMNGQNIPEDEDLKKQLCRLIANRVKSHLKDSSEFNSFTVLFVKRVKEGDLTKRNWAGYNFKSGELTEPFLNIGKMLNSNKDFVYGGSTFTSEDSAIICVLRDFTFVDTSSVLIRIFKDSANTHVLIGQKHIEVMLNANCLLQKINIQPLYQSYGIGKYEMTVLSHDITIASKEFELK